MGRIGPFLATQS